MKKIKEKRVNYFQSGFSLVECLCSLFLLSTFFLFVIPSYLNIERATQSQLLETEARLMLEREMLLQELAESGKIYRLPSRWVAGVDYQILTQITKFPNGKEVQVQVIWQNTLQQRRSLQIKKEIYQPKSKKDTPT